MDRMRALVRFRTLNLQGEWPMQRRFDAHLMSVPADKPPAPPEPVDVQADDPDGKPATGNSPEPEIGRAHV